MKFAEAPGASVAAVKTGVVPVRSLVTTMLVSVMLPALLTLPVKVSRPPGLAGLAGQFCVTVRRGVVPSGQVADATLVTMFAVQASVPRALTVLVTKHELPGAVKLAVKFADAPGARVGTVSTVLGEAWLSVTTTLFSGTLPGLLTVPL